MCRNTTLVVGLPWILEPEISPRASFKPSHLHCSFLTSIQSEDDSHQPANSSQLIHPQYKNLMMPATASPHHHQNSRTLQSLATFLPRTTPYANFLLMQVIPIKKGLSSVAPIRTSVFCTPKGDKRLPICIPAEHVRSSRLLFGSIGFVPRLCRIDSGEENSFKYMEKKRFVFPSEVVLPSVL
jgi:hypothetical protein